MAADFFWDTRGFSALLNSDDPAHERARTFLRQAQTERQRGVTSSWVVGETCTLLLARKRPHLVPQFLDYVQPSRALLCVHPDESHFRQTCIFLRKHLDQGYSFTDCSSLVLMREFRIRIVLTSDRHFAQAGCEAVLIPR